MAAALVLRGADAQLNFPNLASSLPRPQDLTDKSIQAAAIEAAQNFARQVRSHNRALIATMPAATSTIVSQAHILPASATTYNSSTTSSSTSSSRDSQPIRTCQELPDHQEFESAVPRVMTDHSLSDVGMDPEVEEIESSHHGSNTHFMEVDMFYSMPELPLHSTSLDSDQEGTYNSYSWEPRLWSF